jgi:uncharacterized protein (DUF362 family)
LEALNIVITDATSSLRSSICSILGPYTREILAKHTVFLKPNIVFPVRANRGEITDPEIVETIVLVLREFYSDLEIVIGEGTAAGTVPEENFQVSGYTRMAKRLGVELIDLNRAERTKIQWAGGELDLPTIATRSFYVNLPVLKVSSAAIFSAAMKNQKGLLAPETKKSFHRRGLHEAIYWLSLVIQPALTILDARPYFRGNVLIAGDSMVQVDNLVSDLLGIHKPEYLARALASSGPLISMKKYSDFSLSMRRRFRAPGRYKRFLGLRLWANPAACSMCRLSMRSLRIHSVQDLMTMVRICWRLFCHALRGADVVFGKDPKMNGRGLVICFGDCTRGFARSNNSMHIPGCPPKLHEIARRI